MRIFLTGGTGLVGSRLIRRLLDRKDQIVLLTRRPEVARQKWADQCSIVQGDPMQPGSWQDAVADCDAVVNLVGESIFSRRWSAPFKELLRHSRVQSTDNVVQALAKSPRTAAGTPKVLVSASAIGFYGPHGDEELTEESAAGSDTMAQLCVAWEKGAQAAETAGVRVTLLRIGVVLDKEGGAEADVDAVQAVRGWPRWFRQAVDQLDSSRGFGRSDSAGVGQSANHGTAERHGPAAADQQAILEGSGSRPGSAEFSANAAFHAAGHAGRGGASGDDRPARVAEEGAGTGVSVQISGD